MAQSGKSENQVKDIVRRAFKALRIWSYAPIQNGLGQHGIPDRVGCMPVVVTPQMVGKTIGVFVAVECKREGRRNEPRRGMSVHQELTLLDITNAGGITLVCDGEEDLNEFHKRVETLKGQP